MPSFRFAFVFLRTVSWLNLFLNLQVFRAAGLAEATVEEVCGGDDETARDDERGVCGVRFFDCAVCEHDEEKPGGECY